MDRPSTFAKRLRELLDARNITQAELSRKTGISKSSISHYLKGDWAAKPDAIYTISKFENVNEAWLMGYDVPMNKIEPLSFEDDFSKVIDELTEPERSMELLAGFTKLSEDDKDFLMETLELLLIRRGLNPGPEPKYGLEITVGIQNIQKQNIDSASVEGDKD